MRASRRAPLGRGEFLRLSLGYATLGALAPFSPSFAQTPSGAPVDSPNILLIVTDDQPAHTADLRPGRDGSLGADDYWMPKLHTHLRSQGMEFEAAYVAMPACSPSRASVLTGLYPHNHGVEMNRGAALAYRKERLASRSVAALLRDHAGVYKSGLFGKLLNHYKAVTPWIPPGYLPREGGAFFGSLNNSEPLHVNANGRVRWAKWANGNRVKPRDEVRWFTDRLLGWISDAEEPWFAVLSASAPHSPATPSDANRGTFAGVAQPKRPNFGHIDPNKPQHIRRLAGLSPAEETEMGSRWRGEMEELQDVDDQIERVCQAVDFETTYVFFLSDNGYQLGEHGWRGKSQPYEESVKTPLIVRGPGITPSTKDSHLVSLVDVTATVLELGGVDTEELAYHGIPLDGRSLSPLMFTFPEEDDPVEAPGEVDWRESLLIESVRREPESPGLTAWWAMRDESSIYIEHDTGERECYLMDEDPFQLRNVAHELDEATLSDYSVRLDSMRGASGWEGPA